MASFSMRLIAAAAIATGICGSAHATPLVNAPIDLENVTFSDGTALTGEFSLNVYGYLNGTWSFATSAGHSQDATPIAAFDFTSSSGSDASIQTPPGSGVTYEVEFFNGSYSEMLFLTFAHPLGTAGPDPLVIDPGFTPTPGSAECAGYSCTSSDERLIAGGFAQVPEPASLTIIGAGMFGLAMLRRRRSR